MSLPPGLQQTISNWTVEVGSFKFSVLQAGEFLVLLAIVLLLSALVRRMLRARILVRTGLTPGLQEVLSRFASYGVIIFGFLISLQVMGIKVNEAMHSLALVAGALSVGIGFGLQNIISNFVSGLIILIERPIQVGDRVDVGGLEGDVAEINARSTKIVTNNNITIIVPNSEFITARVVNWSHGDPKVRIPIPVGVAYGSDPRLVERALLEVADECVDALKDPAPGVRFMSYGDSSLHFELRVWTETQVQHKYRLISAVNFKIFEKFNKYGIEVPFPQRDVHIRTIVPIPGPASPAVREVEAEEVAVHMRRNRLFHVLSDEEISRLVSQGAHRKFYPMQKILEQGIEGDSLFVLIKGIAAVEVRLPEGGTSRVHTLGRGDFFGEMSMLTGERRSATILAETAVEALEICKASMQPILESNPHLAEELSRVLAERESRDVRGGREGGVTGGARERGILGRIQSFFGIHNKENKT